MRGACCSDRSQTKRNEGKKVDGGEFFVSSSVNMGLKVVKSAVNYTVLRVLEQTNVLEVDSESCFDGVQ